MQMKNRRILGVCLAAGALAWNLNAHGAANRQARRAEPRRSIRVLLVTGGHPLVTGGHPFETNAFLNIFQSMRGVRLRHATQPEAQQWWRPDKRDAWDVLVLYDLWQEISPQAKEDFLSCLKEGKGLVVLHHALADYQDWPEFFAVAGGRYNLKPRKEKGKTIPADARHERFHDPRRNLREARALSFRPSASDHGNAGQLAHTGVGQPVARPQDGVHPTRPRPFRLREPQLPPHRGKGHPLGVSREPFRRRAVRAKADVSARHRLRGDLPGGLSPGRPLGQRD